MSAIDEELERAVREAESEAAASPEGAQTVATLAGGEPSGVSSPLAGDGSAKPGGSRWGLLLGLFALMGVVLTLVFTSEGEAVVYAYGVDEVNAKASDLGDRRVRIVGDLVSGTLMRRDNPCEYRFQLGTGDERIKVHYQQCVVPDTFRDVEGVKVEVTAEGRLADDGHLEASKIMAKCPSKYEMRESAGDMKGRPDHGAGQEQPRIIPPKAMPGIN